MNGLLPGIAEEIIVALSAASVTGASGYVVYKVRQVNTHNVILQGVDGVEELGGLIGSVEILNQEVEGNSQNIEEVEEDMEKVRSKLSAHTDLINDLDSSVTENQEDIEKAKSKMGELNERVDALYRDIAERNNDS